MKRTRGFSLIEAMLAMGLVFTILGLVSTLMREYSSVSRHSAARDNTRDGVQFALAEMRNDLSSAVQVVSPGPGGSGSTLEFVKMDPGVQRFPKIEESSSGGGTAGGFVPSGGVIAVPMDDPDDAPKWDPRDPMQQMTVTYSKDVATGALMRKVSNAPATFGREEPTTEIMAVKISGMNIRRLDNGYFELSLSFQEERRLHTFVTQARVWSKLGS